MLQAVMAAVSAITLTAEAGTVYITDGVNKDDVIGSERFFDTGKGYYFEWLDNNNYYTELRAEYNKQGNFAFLGDLCDRMPSSAGSLEGYFVNLTDDKDTCWAQAAMNLVEYWHTYYGVFYRGERDLLYGYTYDEAYLGMTGGTLSLKQNLVFLDTFNNEGDHFGSYIDWYMSGDDKPSYSEVEVKGQGGYWKDVFGSTAHRHKAINRYSELTSTVISMMGYEKDGNGNYVQTTKGQLLGISMEAHDEGGHAIAGHGFELNAAGQLTALWVTNSDDIEYKLFPLYLNPEQSRPWLYEDEACTVLWEYADSNWYIDWLYCIDTPEEFVTMQEQYSNPERAIFWNGQAPGNVVQMEEGSLKELPTAETGWDVYLSDAGEYTGYYHTWYGNCSYVCFNDAATSGTVRVNSTLNPYSVQFLNTNLAYTVTGTGTSSGGINVSFLYQGNGGKVQLNSMRVQATQMRLNAGSMTLNSSLLRGSVLGVENAATLTLNNSAIQLSGSGSALTLGGTLKLAGSSSIGLNGGSLIFQAGSTLAVELGTTTASITGGSLRFDGAVNIVVSGAGLVDSHTYYILGIDSFSSSQLSNMSCASGVLGYDGSSLTLTYYSNTWKDYSGTWSSTRWAGNYESRDGMVARFSGASSAQNKVSISGEVAPSSIYISSGNYLFSNAGGGSISTGLLQISGTSALTTDILPSADLVEVGGSAEFTLRINADDVQLPSIALATGASLNLSKTQSSRVSYTTYAPQKLNGQVTVADGVGLRLRGEGTVQVDAVFNLGNDSGLYLNPATYGNAVTYKLKNSVRSQGGYVVIGYDDSTVGATRVYAPAASTADYYLWKSGELVLQGTGDFTGHVYQNGSLVVDSGADVRFGVSSNVPVFSSEVNLEVLGSAAVGSESNPLNSTLANAVTVEGKLTLAVDCTVGATSSKRVSLNIPSLTLRGGTVQVDAYFDNPKQWSSLQTNCRLGVDTLTLDGGGTIMRTTPNGQGYYEYGTAISVGTLQGRGDLTLDVDTWNQFTRVTIADLSAYTGNINVLNTSTWRENADSNGNVVHFHVNALELVNQELKGAVHLAVTNREDYATAALGVSGRVSVQGLSSAGTGPVYLFSGTFSRAECLTQKGFFYHTAADSAAVLSVNTGSESYSFGGTVGASLSLEKKGSGTQSFTGDMSAFNGSLAVQEGVLDVASAFSAASAVLHTGTTLRARSGASISSLTLGGGAQVTATGGALTLANAAVYGANTLTATAFRGTEWIFNLTTTDRKKLMLNMQGTSSSAVFSLENLTLSFDEASLANGYYYLFAYDDNVSLSGSISLTNSYSDFYHWENMLLNGENMHVLVYEHTTGEDAPMERDFTTLIWTGTGSVWAASSGEESAAWSCQSYSKDLNYYNGDSVLFSTAGTVCFSGKLRPASVMVNHDSGSLLLKPENSASVLSGNMSLTKMGGGKLIVAGNNSYTGTTYLLNGTLEAASEQAFGTGTIKVSGGTLELGRYALSNDIIAEGGTISAVAHTGLLNVNGDVTLAGNGTSGRIKLSSGGVLRTSAGLTLQSGESLIIEGGSVQGNLTLAGGELHFSTKPLTVSGVFAVTELSAFSLSGYELGKEYTLVNYGSFSGDVGLVDLPSTGVARLEYELTAGSSALTLRVVEAPGTLSWIGGKKAVWAEGNSTLWNDGMGGSAFYASDHVTFTSGSISISGEVQPGSVLVACDKSVTFKTSYKKKTASYTGAIIGNASLTKYGKGKLTLNDGNLNWYGDTYLHAGSIIAKGATSFGRGDIYVYGGTLDLKSKAVMNDVVLEGNAVIKGGKKYTGHFTLAGGELMKGSSLSIAGNAELASGTVNGTLSGVGTVAVTGDVFLNTKGKITAYTLDITGALSASSKGLAMNTKTSAITIDGGSLSSAGKVSAHSMLLDGGTLDVTNGKPMSVSLKGAFAAEANSVVHTYGAFSAASFGLVKSEFELAMDAADITDKLKPKAQSVSVKGAALLQDSDMVVAGKMTVGSLSMQNSSLWLYDPSGKNKAMGLTSKGALTLGSGSSITLSGKLSAKDLTLTGGSVTFTSSKLQTIAVKNQLTLSGEVDLNMCCNLVAGKEYKLFTFKSGVLDAYTSDALASMLGLEDAGCRLNVYSKSITLTVLNPYLWQDYIEENIKAATAVSAADSVCRPDAEDVADSSAEELLTAPKPVAAAVDPLLRKAADTLVQSTWGTVNASRAFGDTIAARGAHATLLAEGRGAAWLSTMGGSSRISTDGERNGADFTLSGAAFGVEGRVTEKSTLGVAIGNSWGKVSTFSAFPVDQDSMHIGIYGNHTLTESLTLSWMATHTRTESELNLLGLPYEWAQDALQLDARLTWATAISDKTTLRVFGGLQYLATDSGESNGLKTGSVQNLRGELGIGASHKCSDSTLVFGELSFVGDMVRNNPTADLGGMRLRGSNPGRAGINLSVGAAHRLSDDWSLNASYSFELMQNVTSHSLNVGASYSF